MRYTVLGFLCLATVIAYVQRSALGVPSKAIETELGLRPEEMGLVLGAWYWVYAFGQLPAGWLADRIGGKAALILFAVGWSVLTALAGLATDLAGLLVLWAAMGAGQAGLFPCATKAIGATFPKTRQAFASGCLACGMALGAALAQDLTGRLFGPLTWQTILVVYAVPGLVWAAAFALLVPPTDAPPPAVSAAPVRWSRLVTAPDMILLCAQQLLRAGATALFFTWFPRFLQETKGITPAESGTLGAWPLIAGMAGGPVGGTLSDWLLRRTGSTRVSRQGLSVVAMAVCAGVALAADFVTDAENAVLLISVAVFCGYVGGTNAYAVAIALGGTRVARVFATMNMAGNVGAGLFPFAVGVLVAHTGSWKFTLPLYASMYAASGVCWLFLNPKGTLFDEEPT